jgi:hypothetical protein
MKSRRLAASPTRALRFDAHGGLVVLQDAFDVPSSMLLRADEVIE